MIKPVKCKMCGLGKLFYFRGDERWGVICHCRSETATTAFRAILRWNLKQLWERRAKRIERGRK